METAALAAWRSEVSRSIRSFFFERDFLELDAPLLVPAPGQEPYLSPFETTLTGFHGVSRPAYLTTSPEYSAKKLLAAGVKRLFVLGHAFRDGEEHGGNHQPEFTMLEWYRANADYRALMDDVDDLLRFFGRFHELNHETAERLTVAGAFRRYAGLGERALLAGSPNERYDDWFFKIFLTEIEPRLGRERPTILYDYPAPLAALARLKPGDPRYAERFEVYARGLELANAFSELTDASEQRRRLEEEQTLRRALGKPVFPLDEAFLEAVGRLPPCTGIALGVDRLLMLLADTNNIEDVVLFPASKQFS